MNYFEVKALSNSSMKYLLQSESAFLWHLNNPKKPTPAMEFGTMVHKYLLEQQSFWADYVLIPDKPENANGSARRDSAEYLAYKEWKETTPELDGKKPISINEINTIGIMADNFKQKLSEERVNIDLVEQEIFWTEFEETTLSDVPLKAKLDGIDTNTNTIIDIKTIDNLNDYTIISAIKNMQYYRQEAMYRVALTQLRSTSHSFDINVKPESIDFLFFFIEKNAPFDCRVVRLAPDYVEYGFAEMQMLITKYAQMNPKKPKGYDKLTIFKPAFFV